MAIPGQGHNWRDTIVGHLRLSDADAFTGPNKSRLAQLGPDTESPNVVLANGVLALIDSARDIVVLAAFPLWQVTKPADTPSAKEALEAEALEAAAAHGVDKVTLGGPRGTPETVYLRTLELGEHRLLARTPDPRVPPHLADFTPDGVDVLKDFANAAAAAAAAYAASPDDVEASMAFFRRNDEFRSGSDDRFDRAMAAGRAGNGIEEQRLYAELADEGYQHAMHNLGVILRDAGDTQQAVAWFTRAAEAGATQSLKALAGHYHDLREREAALRWAHAYVERAKVGTAMGEKADAMKDLGILLNDYGMTAEALEWSRKAGESGSRDGLFNTGVLLAGQGDSVEAAQWFLRAAAAGHPSGLAAAAEVQATASPAPRPTGAATSTKKEGCFIATAVYGSYEAPPVLVLRQFRDERLVSTALGRASIRFYYAVSPTLVRRFGGSSSARRAARFALDRIVGRLERAECRTSRSSPERG